MADMEALIGVEVDGGDSIEGKSSGANIKKQLTSIFEKISATPFNVKVVADVDVRGLRDKIQAAMDSVTPRNLNVSFDWGMDDKMAKAIASGTTEAYDESRKALVEQSKQLTKDISNLKKEANKLAKNNADSKNIVLINSIDAEIKAKENERIQIQHDITRLKDEEKRAAAAITEIRKQEDALRQEDEKANTKNSKNSKLELRELTRARLAGHSAKEAELKPLQKELSEIEQTIIDLKHSATLIEGGYDTASDISDINQELEEQNRLYDEKQKRIESVKEASSELYSQFIKLLEADAEHQKIDLKSDPVYGEMYLRYLKTEYNKLNKIISETTKKREKAEKKGDTELVASLTKQSDDAVKRLNKIKPIIDSAFEVSKTSNIAGKDKRPTDLSDESLSRLQQSLEIFINDLKGVTGLNVNMDTAPIVGELQGISAQLDAIINNGISLGVDDNKGTGIASGGTKTPNANTTPSKNGKDVQDSDAQKVKTFREELNELNTKLDYAYKATNKLRGVLPIDVSSFISFSPSDGDDALKKKNFLNTTGVNAQLGSLNISLEGIKESAKSASSAIQKLSTAISSIAAIKPPSSPPDDNDSTGQKGENSSGQNSNTGNGNSGDIDKILGIVTKLTAENIALKKDVEGLKLQPPKSGNIILDENFASSLSESVKAAFKDVKVEAVIDASKFSGADYTQKLTDIHTSIGDLSKNKAKDYSTVLSNISKAINKLPTTKPKNYSTVLKSIKDKVTTISKHKPINNSRVLSNISSKLNRDGIAKNIANELKSILPKVSDAPSQDGRTPDTSEKKTNEGAKSNNTKDTSNKESQKKRQSGVPPELDKLIKSRIEAQREYYKNIENQGAFNVDASDIETYKLLAQVAQNDIGELDKQLNAFKDAKEYSVYFEKLEETLKNAAEEHESSLASIANQKEHYDDILAKQLYLNDLLKEYNQLVIEGADESTVNAKKEEITSVRAYLSQKNREGIINKLSDDAHDHVIDVTRDRAFEEEQKLIYEGYLDAVRDLFNKRVNELNASSENKEGAKAQVADAEKKLSMYEALINDTFIRNKGYHNDKLDTSIVSASVKSEREFAKIKRYHELREAISAYYDAKTRLFQLERTEQNAEAYDSLKEEVAQREELVDALREEANLNENYDYGLNLNTKRFEDRLAKDYKLLEEREKLRRDIENWGIKNSRAKDYFKDGIEGILNSIGTADLDELKLYVAEFQKIKAESQSRGLNGRNPTPQEIAGNITSAKLLMEKLNQLLAGASGKAFTQFGNEINQARDAINSAIGEVWSVEGVDTIGGNPEKLKEAKRQLKELTAQFEQAGYKGKNAFTNIDKAARSLFNLFGGGTIVSQIKSQFTDAYQSIVMLDSAFANIRMTMSMSNAEMRELGDNSIQLSKKLGITLDSVMQAATIYANEKISIDDIIARAEPTALLASAANMEATAAADLIQGVVYQFDLDDSAESLMRVVDSIEAISAATGVEFKRSIEQISEGIQASGAIAHASGYSYQEFAAQIGNLVERTRRSGSEVANGLKMIFARLGQNLEGDATEEEISKAEKAYASLGIALRDGTDDFRDLPDVFEELSVKWQTMTDTEKAYIAEVSAGNRNRSVFMSMMDGYASTLGLVEAAEQSAGFALDANTERMDAYEAKLGKLKATFESFYNNLTDTNSLELIVEGFTKIVELADILINSNIGDFTIKPLAFGWLATSLPSILTELKESQSIAGAVIRGLAKPYEILIQKEKELATAIAKRELVEDSSDADNPKDNAEREAKINAIREETKARMDNTAAIIAGEIAEDKADSDNIYDNVSSGTNGTGVGKSLLGISKASIIISVVTAAITILVNGISKVIEKQEELRQEYEDALNIVEQSTIEYNDNRQTMKETADELHRLIPIYKNLSKGVNSYGHNISLSAEAYETYKDTVTRIAELSPDLVTGHNNEQVALLNVAKAAGNAADEYARMARNAAQAKLDSSNETAVTTLEGYYGKYKWDKSIGEAITDIPMNNYIELWNVVSSHLIDKTLPHQYVTSFKKAFDEAIEGNYDSLGSIDINSGILTDAEVPKEFVNLLEEFQRSYKVNDTLAMNARIKEMSLYSSDIIAAVKEYNDEIHKVQESVGLALTTEIESMEEYYSLSGSAQQMIASMIHTLKQNDIFLMLAAESGGSNIASEAVSIMNAVQNSDLIALYEQMNELNRQLDENKIGYQDYLNAMQNISTQANAIAKEEGVDVSVLFDFSVQQGMFDEYTQKIVREYKASLLRAFESENPEPISIFNPRGPMSISNVPSPNDVEDAIETRNNWIGEGLKYIKRAWNKKLEAHINNLPADKLRFSSEMDIDWGWTIEEFDAELEAQMNKAKEKRQFEFNLLDEGNQEHINTYIESLEKVTSLAKGAEMSGADLIQFMMQFPDFDWEKYGITGEEGVGDFGAAAIAMANTALDDLMLVLPDADDASVKLFKNMAYGAANAAKEIDGVTDAIDKASSLKDTMTSVNEDLTKYGRLTADTLKSILSDFPEMENSVRDYILGNIDQETLLNEYKNKQKLAQEELYYKLVGKLDAAAVNYMKDNYGVDLSNCANYLDAKQELYKKMILANEIFASYISEDGSADFGRLFADTSSESDLAVMSALVVKYKQALDDLFGTLDGSFESTLAELFAPDEAEKLNNILSEMISLYDQIFSGIKSVADIRIEALEAEKEALEEKNEEEQKEIDLIKAKQQLEDARNNKVIREYHEGQGFIWAADQKAIAEAEENLAETEKDAQVDAIDKQIEAINEYVESIDDITEAVERQKNISAAMNYLGITNPEDLLSLSDEQRAALAANYQGLSLASDKQENADKIAQYATLTDEQIAQMFGSNFGITMQNLINSWNGSYFIPDIVQQFVETEKKAIEAAKASAEVNTAETPTQKNVYIESINVTYSGNSFEEFLNDVTRYAYTQ